MFLKREPRLKLNKFYTSCLESKKDAGKKKNLPLFLYKFFPPFIHTILIWLKFNYREKSFEKFFRDSTAPRKFLLVSRIFSRTAIRTRRKFGILKNYSPNFTSDSSKNFIQEQTFKRSNKNSKKVSISFAKFRAFKNLKIQRSWKKNSEIHLRP